MDRDKLAQLRQKKAENKAKLHKELLDSNTSIKDAVKALSNAINSQEPIDLDRFVEQLKDSQTYGEDIKRFETALRESSDKDKLGEILTAVGNINNQDVVTAVNGLIGKIEARTIDQSPEAYQPVRRVRKIGQRLVFDDDPLQVNVAGGGGGGASVQQPLIRNNNSIAVVNIDGSPIGVPVTILYKKLIDETTTANVTYIGEATRGTLTSSPTWKIQRIKENITPITIEWTNGFVAVWDDRVSELYA